MPTERKLIRLTEIKEVPQKWVWRDRIPIGAITDLCGDPAQAKSRITYDVAARITTGQPMPIAKGLPEKFELPKTEMYAEPFHVPEPDELILEERWASGDWFRSGMVWNIGKGRVFYFRPGHETYPVFKEKPILQLLENAVRWLAPKVE